MEANITVNDEYYIITIPTDTNELSTVYDQSYFQLLELRIDHRFSETKSNKSNKQKGGSIYLDQQNLTQPYQTFAAALDRVIMNPISQSITDAFVTTPSQSSSGVNGTSNMTSKLLDNISSLTKTTSAEVSNMTHNITNVTPTEISPIESHVLDDTLSPTSELTEEPTEEPTIEPTIETTPSHTNTSKTYHIRRNRPLKYDGLSVSQIMAEKIKIPSIEEFISGLDYHDIELIMNDIEIQLNYIKSKNKSVKVNMKNIYKLNSRFLLLSVENEDSTVNDATKSVLQQIVAGDSVNFTVEWQKIENTGLWKRYNDLVAK